MLLCRTLRQLRERRGRDAARAWVVINRDDADLYRAALPQDTSLHLIDPPGPARTEAYKFLSSRKLWNDAGRTVVLLGDVWFSDDAFATICDYPGKDWTAFGRAGASRFTGCAYGELFAHSFWDYVPHLRALLLLNRMYRDGSCQRAGSGWAHYQLMTGQNPNDHRLAGRFVSIDDFTEDFDTLDDYRAWQHGRATWRTNLPRS